MARGRSLDPITKSAAPPITIMTESITTDKDVDDTAFRIVSMSYMRDKISPVFLDVKNFMGR